MTFTMRMHELRRSSETGMGLVEVVVSAAVLLLVTIGTLSLIDGSSATVVKNRARTVASNLAEQDQERMRSTRVLSLSNYTSQQTKTVGGVSYTVDSSSEWLRDSTGAPVTCSNGSGQAEYMRITSTVSDAQGTPGVRPVTITSLVAPDVGTFGPQQGTLAVAIKDRSNGPLAGIPVTVTGPQTGTESTNATGCAVFDYYKVGTYTVTFSKAGYVNPLGQTDVTLSGQINAGVVNATAPQLYDQASAITITAITRKSAASPAAQRDPTTIAVPFSANKDAVTVANSGISNGTGRLFFTGVPDAQLKVSPVTATGLFPFAGGDTVYTGRCDTNDPAIAGGGSSYYSTNPGLVPLTPGATSSVAVFQPWVKATVQRPGGTPTPLAGAAVYAKETTTGCNTIYKLSDLTGATGVIEDSLPWGSYQFCATDGTREVRTSSAVLVKGTDPVTVPALQVPTSGGTLGLCTT